VLGVDNLASNNWRTSPVPAPAVIPAPVAYYNVVAFKTPVFDLLVLKILPFGISH